MHDPLIVLKFGGSVLLDEQRLRLAVHEIYRWRRDGWRVLAVVSALAGRTDRLVRWCERVCSRSTPHARAAVLAGGEREAAALLGLQLDRAGVPACVLSPGEARLRGRGPALDAMLDSVRGAVLRRALDRDGVVVFPGFIALDEHDRTITLGRGGSDLTALFLAHALNAQRCRLIKDVDGLYDADPRRAGARARRYARASWADALATDGSIVQPKAVRFARTVNRSFELGRFNGVRPTLVSGRRSRFDGTGDVPHALDVALLGLGTVGGGVLDLIAALEGHLRVTGAAVRDPHRRSGSDPRGVSLTNDAVALARAGADVVVETIGGVDIARQAVEAALRAGAHVVTANKALLAAHGPELRDLAQRCGRRLLASASVGGSVPVIERAAAAPLRSLRGVLNGTANFVLEAVGRGVDLDAAVDEARRLGLAEADASRDLDGRDSLDKLLVLAEAVRFDTPALRAAATAQALSASAVRGRAGPRRLRQVATLEAGAARVRLERVGADDPLFELESEWNALELQRADGRRECWRGRGAGRWPTAESIIGDLLELARAPR